MVEEKKLAPDFELKDTNGQMVKLSQFRGKKVVLYFYPKDDTPGCTKEACSLRDAYSAIQGKNTVILGVSPDDGASHEKFVAKYNLPFTLLSDPDHVVMELFGAWGEKNMYGKISIGVKRCTFVIDEEGTVMKIFRKVNTETHAVEVMPHLG